MRPILPFRALVAALILTCALPASAQTPCVRVVFVDPAGDLVTVKSYEDETVDMSEYSFCSIFSCVDLTDLTTNFGSVVLPAGDSVQFVYSGLSDTAADVGLYADDTEFQNPDFMVDYVQYGGSGGLFNQTTANERGIWDTGDFIDTAPPFRYRGNGCEENGLSFWLDPNGISTSELESKLTFATTPNALEIGLSDLQNAQILLYDANGRLHSNEVVYTSLHRLETDALPQGMYIIQVLVDRAVITKKLVLGGY